MASVQNIEAKVQRLTNLTGKSFLLDHGSPSNGRAWRLWGSDGTDVFFLGCGYLGWTRREAALTLAALISGIEYAATHKIQA